MESQLSRGNMEMGLRETMDALEELKKKKIKVDIDLGEDEQEYRRTAAEIEKLKLKLFNVEGQLLDSIQTKQKLDQTIIEAVRSHDMIQESMKNLVSKVSKESYQHLAN